MKKKTALLLSMFLIFALVLSACGSNSAKTESIDRDMSFNTGASYDSVADMEVSAPSYAPDYKGYEDGLAQSDTYYPSVDSAIYSDPDAKVIRSAELTIQTLDFDQSVLDLADLTEKLGGYYETAQVDAGGYYDQYARRSAYYVVRIPKSNFVSFRTAVSEVGHLYSITEDSRNVGEEYFDAESRLATLETKYERLLALLDKAELMEDIIQLESAIADVQYQIDQYNTTLRRYDSLIDYSTFTIYLNEVVKIVEEPGPQEGFGTRLLANLKEGFSDFTEFLQDFAFWFARNVITLVILAVIIVVIIKVILWNRKKRRSKRGEIE